MLRRSNEFYRATLELFHETRNGLWASCALEQQEAVQVSGGRLPFYCSDKVTSKVRREQHGLQQDKMD
jgi:hypothetical protein